MQKIKHLFFNKKTEHFLKEKVKGVYDELLVHREIFNPNSFDLIITRNKTHDQYVKDAGIPLGLPIMVCKSESWLYLPHGYFFVKAANGAEVGTFITNFGDNIGIGNKYPSLPIAETK